MKISNLLLLLTFLYVSTPSSANTDSEKEAAKLLSLIGMEQVVEQSISQMLDIQLQQNPTLNPYKGVILEFLSKHMSYENLKPDLLKIYSDEFTASELREINRFYATDVGKKTIEKIPALMAQGSQIGAARIQENIGEFEAMIKAESERIQNSQSQ